MAQIPRIVARPATPAPRVSPLAFDDPRGVAALGEATQDVGKAALTIYEVHGAATENMVSAQAASEMRQVAQEMLDRKDFQGQEQEWDQRSKEILGKYKSQLTGPFARHFDHTMFELKERLGLEIRGEVMKKQTDETRAITDLAVQHWRDLAGTTDDPRLQSLYEQQAQSAIQVGSPAYSKQEIVNMSQKLQSDLQIARVERLGFIDPKQGIEALASSQFPDIEPKTRELMSERFQRTLETNLMRQDLEEQRAIRLKEAQRRQLESAWQRKLWQSAVPISQAERDQAVQTGTPLRQGITPQDLADAAPYLSRGALEGATEMVKNGGFITTQTSAWEGLQPIHDALGRGEDVHELVNQMALSNKISPRDAATLLDKNLPLNRYKEQWNALSGTPEQIMGIIRMMTSEESADFKLRLSKAKQDFIEEITANPKMTQSEAWALSSSLARRASNFVGKNRPESTLGVDPKFIPVGGKDPVTGQPIPPGIAATDDPARHLSAGDYDTQVIANELALQRFYGQISAHEYEVNSVALSLRHAAQEYRWNADEAERMANPPPRSNP